MMKNLMKSKSSSLQLAQEQHEVCLERLLSSDDLYASPSKHRLVPRTPPRSPTPFCSGERSPFLRRSGLHAEKTMLPKVAAVSSTRRPPLLFRWYRFVLVFTVSILSFAAALCFDLIYAAPRRDSELCPVVPWRTKKKAWRQGLRLYERQKKIDKKKQNKTIFSEAPTEMIRQSDLIFWGSHNSYHRAPAAFSFPFLGALVPSWAYSHSALTKQLRTGARHLELDVHVDAELRLATVYHVPSLDSRTRCYCLQSCAKALLDWSQSRNGEHSLIFILLEPKGARNIFEDFRTRSRGFGSDLTETKRVLKVLDDALIDAFKDKPEALLTPYDLLIDKDHTLIESVASRGWPDHNALLGKFAFALLDSTPNLALARAYVHDGIQPEAPIFTMATHLDQLLPDHRALSLNSHRGLTVSLQNASKYWPASNRHRHRRTQPPTPSSQSQDRKKISTPQQTTSLTISQQQLPPPKLDAVILKLDNPKRADFFEDCRNAVKKGFLVRTRANTMKRPNDELRFALAIKSGAQLVSFEADAATHWKSFLNQASSWHHICSCDGVALQDSKRKCNAENPPCV